MRKKIKPNLNIMYFIAFISILFIPSTNDPFNNPKFWLLILTGAYLLPLIKFKNIFRSKKISQITVISAILFSLTMFISALLSVDLYTAFFGESQRRNGFLTYFSLIVIFIFIYQNFKIEFINQFKRILISCSLVINGYGLIQAFGFDFIKWNNPYNSLISTFGNPNFSSACIAMLTSFLLIDIITQKQNSYRKIFLLLLIVVSVFNIARSQSRQGFVALFIGATASIIIYYFSRKKIISYLFLAGFLNIYILGILGMLNKGPFSHFLYKDSVSVRGFYWRAAIKMLLDKPFTGVGIDSYGHYFKEYRELQYPIRYGFEITSTNAHSVILQLFSTGGIFVGLTYLILTSLILVVGVMNVRAGKGLDRTFSASLLALWIAFQAQSFISIDNIGISIWGWMIAGIILAINLEIKSENLLGTKFKIQSESSKLEFKKIISKVILIPVFIVVVFLYKADQAAYTSRSLYLPNNPSSQLKSNFIKSATVTINAPLQEPAQKILNATWLVDMGYPEDSRLILENLKRNSNNIDLLRGSAYVNFRIGNITEELQDRKKIEKLDPFNLANLSRMAEIFRLQNDIPSYESYRARLVSMVGSVSSLQYLIPKK